jgi:hypothetical protein
MLSHHLKVVADGELARSRQGGREFPVSIVFGSLGKRPPSVSFKDLALRRRRLRRYDRSMEPTRSGNGTPMPRTIRFHPDENCDRAVAEGLRRRGNDVSATHRNEPHFPAGFSRLPVCDRLEPVDTDPVRTIKPASAALAGRLQPR